MTERISRDDARRLAVRAQLLDAERPGDVVEVAEQIGTVKIDPTATLAPCEHTMLWSRIGWSYEPGQLRKAVEADRLLFEYDGGFHAASLRAAMSVLMRERPLRPRTSEWLEANARFRTDVLERLRGEGPLPAAAIPDTSQVAMGSESGWYGSNQVPRMLELLARQGLVAVVGRQGRNRIWDLGERVYTDEVPDVETAQRLLAERKLQSLGIAKKSAFSPIGAAGVPVEVDGLSGAWRADPAALASLHQDPGGRVAFLNPYDGMLFDRPRLRELFGFTYVLEQFKPRSERVYGHFAHPILLGDRFVGLLDAEVDRTEEVLRVRAVHELQPLEPEEHEMIREELRELGQWLGVPLVGAVE